MKRLVCLMLSLFILMSAVTAYALSDDVPSKKRNEKLDAAFDSGNPELSETGSATIKLQISDFEISDDAKAALMEIGNIANIDAALAAALADAEFILLSKSPAGNSGFITDGASAAMMYNGKYHLAYPSTKGVPDDFSNLETFCSFFSSKFQSLLGEEGIVYSADGRYAAICNKKITLTTMRLFLDPILLDLSTGELILTATYPNQPLKEENAGAVTSALFSSDNRYFYYILYGNFSGARIRLYRYDLEKGGTELCLESRDNLYYPHLAELEDGSLLMINDCYKSDESEGLVIASCTGGVWSIEETKLKLNHNYCYAGRLMYSSNSGLACLVENTGNSSVTFQLINPNTRFEGIDQFWCIRKETDEIEALSPEEFQASVDADVKDGQAASMLSALYPYQTIYNAVFSPDGNYLLLHTLDDSVKGSTRNLFLLRLEDMALRKVSGLDAEKILVSVFGRNYPMNIEWNTDELIIGTDDGIRTFEFTAGK